MKKYIEDHKLLVIIGVVALIFIIVIVIGFKNMYFSSNGDVYGNRLEGIDKVPIKKDTINTIKEELKNTDKVESTNITIQGKIVYFIIDYKEDVSLDQAREIATKTLVNLSDEQKEFYDFNYSLTQSKVKDSENYPTMGYKHPNSATILWLQNS